MCNTAGGYAVKKLESLLPLYYPPTCFLRVIFLSYKCFMLEGHFFEFYKILW